MQGRTTQSEVAKRAGVHVSTVSLALRNHPSLPQETRERLQALATEMGYRPDPSLRALIAYRRNAGARKEQAPLAYLTRWETSHGWQEAPAHLQFHKGASTRAQQLGYEIEHHWLGQKGMTGRRMSGILAARGIKGVIIASHQQDHDELESFEWEHFSAVKIDFLPELPMLHNVTNDQRAIVRLAVRRVLAAGYRRIGFVMFRAWDEFVSHGWTAGFLAEQYYLPPQDRIPILMVDDAERDPSTHSPAGESPVPVRLLKPWLDQHRPDVVISYARFVMPAFAALGIRIPEDFAFADVYLHSADGQFAGVQENCSRVGELAVEILAGQLEQNIVGIPKVPTATYVEGTWFDGASLPILTTSSRPKATLA